MSPRATQLDELYSLLDAIAQRCGGPRTLADCHGRMAWPRRGVYFFFETGEHRENGSSPRVVRVGTHGLRPSSSTLWGRLSQHRGSAGGGFPGGGNHRGSIFRLHVGEALLATGNYPPEISGTWGHGSSAPPNVRTAEYSLERDVSTYIRAMPFLWVEVDDAPGPDSERGLIERGAIAVLSNLARPPVDPPSPTWLGQRSAREAIRRSGLWNVNHVRDPIPDDAFLDSLARCLG